MDDAWSPTYSSGAAVRAGQHTIRCVSTVFLATCADLPFGDAEGEGPPLTAACERAGLDVRWAVWDDPSIAWSEADLVVIRSTWDYTERRDDFLTWAADRPALANPLPVLTWNSDKTYLRELASAGLPVVPTEWAEPGEDVDLPQGRDFVVKPAVGAGSMGAGRFSGADPDALASARRHVARLHAIGRTVMVQPYLEGVDEAGETALIFIGGRFSHAIRKGPMLPEPVVYEVARGSTHDLFVAENITPREPSAAEHDVAERVLAQVPDAAGLLYARVDLLPSPDGPVLIELELTEPSLFLQHDNGSADRLAAAIVSRIAVDERAARG